MQSKDPAPMRVGLVGLGRHGRRYATHLAAGDVPGAVLGGFWRRDPARAAEDAATFAVRAYPTWEALVGDPAIDALAAAVPAALHRAVAEAACAAGKPLLLEKPLAGSLEDGLAIAAVARGQRVMIAHTLRFDPLVQLLRRRVAEGALGELRGFGLEQRLEPRGLPWEADPEVAGGGVLLQTGIHAVDALRFVTGAELRSVEAAVLDRLRGARTEDRATVLFTVAGGAARRGVSGDLRVSKAGASRHHRYQLFFEDGGLEADLIDRVAWQTRGRVRTRLDVPEAPTVAAALEAFVRWCRTPELPAPITAEDALHSLEVVFAAYAAAQRTGGIST